MLGEHNHDGVTWDKVTEENFEKILDQVPVMLRGVAEARVSKRAAAIARQNNRDVVMEKDMVDAFFAETPGGFLGPMKCGMEEVGVDYIKYGYKR